MAILTNHTARTATRTSARSKAAPVERAAEGRFESIEVRWPGDNSQRMYRAPQAERGSWPRRHAGLVASGAALAVLLGSTLRAPEPAAKSVAKVEPAAVGARVVELPDYSDAYLERYSIRPQSEMKKAQARIEYADIHRAR